MKSENYIKIEFPSRSVNEGFARAAAAAFAAQLDPTLEELGDIRTAVSEAVTNCIVHAYPDSIGRVLLRLRIMRGGRLEIVVKDWGRGIEDVQKAREPLFTTGGAERSGMGFTIMESFTDKLRVRSSPGRGAGGAAARARRLRRALLQLRSEHHEPRHRGERRLLRGQQDRRAGRQPHPGPRLYLRRGAKLNI